MKKKEEERKLLIEKSLLSSIPEEYKDFYPLARQIKRRFILHIGPTNSGKTYQAMQALRKCGSGIYLAPLRLLAFEQFESLNKDNYLCNLITGEEKIRTPSALIQSSTIEMADFTTHYKIAVIDEAQMLADEKRGGAWTAAIMGLYADEIHVCAAPHAQNILIRLIRECGDDFEIIQHERNTPLIVENEAFHFPKDVRAKDALIVFSRKNAHAVAAELQRKGRRCSIIYGSLPYDVRQREAQKFLSGETEILVATDAIGMGMNLPIQRVVFLEISKYDGIRKRRLEADEIQQIAGRAGRRGIYDTGLVNCEEYKLSISQEIYAAINPIDIAILRFPESLLGIDASLSEILDRWNKLPCNPGYKKESVSEKSTLCKELEAWTDHKRLIYDFITIPFDPKNERLKMIWKTLFTDELKQKDPDFHRFLPTVSDNLHNEYLHILEEDYKVCDLLFFYMERFHSTVDTQEILELKKQISTQILRILNRQKLTLKTCRTCGKIMPWNHPYGMCESCYTLRTLCPCW